PAAPRADRPAGRTRKLHRRRVRRVAARLRGVTRNRRGMTVPPTTPTENGRSPTRPVSRPPLPGRGSDGAVGASVVGRQGGRQDTPTAPPRDGESRPGIEPRACRGGVPGVVGGTPVGSESGLKAGRPAAAPPSAGLHSH